MRFRSDRFSGRPRLARSHGGAARICTHGATAGRYGGGLARSAGAAVAVSPRCGANRSAVNALLTIITKWPTFVTGVALVRPNPRPVSQAISYRQHRQSDSPNRFEPEVPN